MSQLSITTTQNVNINFNTATVGQRVLAYLIDVAIIAAYAIVIKYIVFAIFDINNYLEDADVWTNRAVYGVAFIPIMFYALWQESLMDGQTIGKRILKIKVIKIDGYQAGFGDYLIRWIFRIVEVTYIMGIIGLITLIVNKKTQRFGDLAAGTAVISLKNDVTINHTILREIGSNYVPQYPLVIKLSDNDVRIIKETYESSYNQTDFVMIQKLQHKIEAVTGIKSVSQNATAFVDTVLKDYNYYTQNM